MTFKGDTIVGKPTFAMVEIYIAEKGLFCDAKECFDYWENKEWLTKKGSEVKTLESAINVFNGIVVHKALPKKEKVKHKKNGFIVKLNSEPLSVPNFIMRYFPKTKRELMQNKRLYFGKCKQGEEYKLFSMLVSDFPNDKKKEIKEYIQSIPYTVFLNSIYWRIVSSTIKHRQKKCSLCGKRIGLQVHHKNYKHHGFELQNMDDLIVLCRDCHKKIHNIK